MLTPYDIRCNAIASGIYLSEMTEPLYKSQGLADRHNVEGAFPKKIHSGDKGADEGLTNYARVDRE
jgi:hypothetical protein